MADKPKKPVGSAWQKLTKTGPYAKPKTDWKAKQAAQKAAGEEKRSRAYVASLPGAVQAQMGGIGPVTVTAKRKEMPKVETKQVAPKPVSRSTPAKKAKASSGKRMSGQALADYLGLGAGSAVRKNLTKKK